MTLIDHIPHVGLRARALSTRLLSAAPLLYEALLRPLPEPEAVYMAMSSQIQQYKGRTSADRRYMHEYASSLIVGDGSVPSGMDALLASLVEEMLVAQRFHYRQMHPFRAYRKVAA